MLIRLMDETLTILENAADDLEKKEDVILFSIIGHSLGGLWVRSLIGWLFGEALIFIDPQLNETLRRNVLRLSARRNILFGRVDIVPVGFYTVSTPHLGNRRPGLGLHGTMLTGIAWTCSWCMPTMGELFVFDRAQSLIRLSDPEGPFMKTLAKFPCRTMMGHVQDSAVPLASALAYPHHSFKAFIREIPQFQITYMNGQDAEDTEYLHLIQPQAHDTPFEHTDTLIAPISQSMSPRSTRPRSSSSAASYFVPGSDLNYPTQVVENIQKLSFRRIAFDYGIGSMYFAELIHAAVIGKEMVPNWQSRMFPDPLTDPSQKTGLWIANLIVSDFERFVSKKAGYVLKAFESRDRE